jgi:cell division protein FtsB
MIDVLLLAFAVYLGGSGIAVYAAWRRRERLRLEREQIELDSARARALEDEIRNLRGGI